MNKQNQEAIQRRLIIAGTGSSVGKTTLTIGIMSALRKRGLVVQGFKCGPDYIDPTYHTAVTSRPSRNLDSWMMNEDCVREVFNRGSKGADISIIEGVMGLFDGRSSLSNEGSTAHISEIVEAPVLLVLNVQSMARSTAAIVKGFQSFSPGVRIGGIIANKAGSESHYKLVKDAIEQECGVPVIGHLKRDMQLGIPERHLGLVPSIGRGELEPFFTRLGEQVAEHIDLDRLLEIAESPPLSLPLRLLNESPLFTDQPTSKRGIRLAVAKDAAFHFYYPENLELLEQAGAELVFFSPLAGERVPADADGLYIGGGFPEEFAGRLAELTVVKESFKQRIEQGLPTLAECGGFMFLTDSIEDTQGNRYPMVGLIQGQVVMQTKFAALGYREVTGMDGNFLLGTGDIARGHEFHYSTFQPGEQLRLAPAFESQGRAGTKPEGYAVGNLVAGYPHVHFASNPGMIQNWLNACELYNKEIK